MSERKTQRTRSRTKTDSGAEDRRDGSRRASADREQRSVVITGVTRIVARQLAQALYDDDRINAIIGVSSERDIPYYFRDLDPERFIYKPVNLLKYRHLNNLFKSDEVRKHDPDTVVHLDFMGDPRGYSRRAHDHNVLGTRNLIRRVTGHSSIRKFIFLSSGIVYKLRGNTDAVLYEDHELNFDPDAHPIVKDCVDAEMILHAYLDSEQLDMVILRPSGKIGRNILSELNAIFDSLVCLMPAGYDPMVNPIHMADVIRALKTVISEEVSGIFNIAGKDVAPLSEFVRLSGTPVISLPSPVIAPVNWLLRKSGLTRYDTSVNPERMRYSMVLSSKKANEAFGFVPREHIKFA